MRLEECDGFFPTVREFETLLRKHGWSYCFAGERMFATLDDEMIDITLMDGYEFLTIVLGY